MMHVVVSRAEDGDHLLLRVLQRPAVLRHLQRFPLCFECLENKQK